MLSLKDRIIHEALRQFSSKGFMSTSISDILESAGASKGGLYNHFKSKEDLFFAALSEARKIWRQRNLAGLNHSDAAPGQTQADFGKLSGSLPGRLGKLSGRMCLCDPGGGIT